MPSNNRPRVLLVDGHSIIFQWPDLQSLHQNNSLAARRELIRLMTRLQDITDWHVALVFDGTGSKATLSSDEQAIQVFYSQAGQTADSVIERLVAKYAPQYDITVATDDNSERDTVAVYGAHWMSSAELRNRLKEANEEIEEAIRKRK